VFSNPASGNRNASRTVAISRAMSEPVAVRGTPTHSLNVRGGAATFDAASSTPTALDVTKLNLRGGASIQDLAGNAVAKIPAANLGLKVDTLAPTVSSVTASHRRGTSVGDPITIKLTMNESVTVSGKPELLLSNGGIAVYNASASTAKALVFDTTVGTNQGTGSASLSVVGVQLDSPDAIKDGAGNIASLTLSPTQANLGFTVTSTPAGSAPAIALFGTQEAEIFGPSSQNVSFATGANGTLMLDAATAYSGTVWGLAPGDTLDLSNLSYGTNMTAGFSEGATGGVLSVSNGVDTANIALYGNFTNSAFTLASDGYGGTTVVDPLVISATPSLAAKHP
jgi:hypothetical protein